MAAGDPVEDYLAALSEPRRRQLKELRQTIRAALPDARESLRFGMPTYDGPSGMLCAFASQKRHMSFYLCDNALVERIRSRVPKADCGKGCLRFTSLADLPSDVLEEILREVRDR